MSGRHARSGFPLAVPFALTRACRNPAVQARWWPRSVGTEVRPLNHPRQQGGRP